MKPCNHFVCKGFANAGEVFPQKHNAGLLANFNTHNHVQLSGGKSFGMEGLFAVLGCADWHGNWDVAGTFGAVDCLQRHLLSTMYNILKVLL